ncbi:hypothetical protein JW964_20900 [candidate division KSB1 bacterium]|nr:hypothetical protein [candidate division KSB1 bacterium]
MSEQFIYQPTQIIDAFEKAGNWTMQTGNCVSCHASLYANFCQTVKGNYCFQCAEEMLREVVNEVDLKDWSVEQVIKILRSSTPLNLLLTVLWRYEEIKKLFPNPTHEQYKLFNQLLVHKLTFYHRNPLADLVQQAAHEACLREGKHLLPLILRLATSTQQLLPKVILTAGKMAPEDKIVQNLLENAARSNRYDIHEQVALALKDCELPWAKNLFDRVWAKLQPNVKQRIGAKMARIQTSASPDVPLIPDLVMTTFPEVDQVIYQKLLIEIEYNYSLARLQQYYKRYLYQFFENPAFKKKYRLEQNKLRKADYMHGLAIIYSSKDLFLKLYSFFPDQVRKIFEKLLWGHEPFKVDAIENEFKVSLMTEPASGPAQLLSDYLIFQAKTEYNYNFYAFSNIVNYLFLTDPLKKQFQTYFSLPDTAKILPLEKPEYTEFVHEDQARILEQISVYMYYLEQNYLEYTSNHRVLKNSLKQMAKNCQIVEFYEFEKGELAFLKTNLIIEFLKARQFKENKDLLKNIKGIFDVFFHDAESKFFSIPSIFHFIRRLGSYQDWFSLEYQPKGPNEFLKLLKQFPLQKWISIKNIISHLYYKGVFYNKEDYYSVSNCYQKLFYSKFGYQNQDEYVPFNSEIYYDFYITPVFKSVMFLLGAFGIVDLAYQSPLNEKYQRGKDLYLSPFDGLEYIRLTELGAFIIGLKNDFQVTISPEKSFKLTLDEKNLLIFLEGENSIKRIILEKLGEKINTNCYRITSKSFLSDCRTREDIQKKIELFKKNISNKPAPIWQDFFQQIEEKINPLKFRDDLLVFQINPNNQLLQLLVKDEILKNCILKAENYNILIEQKNFNKIKKRLEEFGYFIDIFQIQTDIKDYY